MKVKKPTALKRPVYLEHRTRFEVLVDELFSQHLRPSGKSWYSVGGNYWYFYLMEINMCFWITYMNLYNLYGLELKKTYSYP